MERCSIKEIAGDYRELNGGAGRAVGISSVVECDTVACPLSMMRVNGDSNSRAVGVFRVGNAPEVLPDGGNIEDMQRAEIIVRADDMRADCKVATRSRELFRD